MPPTCMPSPYQTVLDGNGDPINGAKVFVYIAGTTTKTTTWTDSTGTVANSNPILADSAGRFVAFLDSTTAYKFVYALPTDSDPPVSPFKTVDGVLAAAPFSGSTSFTGVLGETVAIRNLLYLSDGTGGLTAGRWYKADSALAYKSSYARKYAFATTAGNAGASITLLETGSMTGFAGLTPGATYYMSTSGAIATTGYRAAAVADTATSILIVQSPPAPMNVDELGTAGQTLAAGSVCYQNEGGITGGKWFLADADLVTTSGTVKNIGFAVETIGNGEVGVIRRLGSVTPSVGLTAGLAYYISATSGQVTSTPPVTYPQFPRLVGIASSSTTLSICATPPLQDFAFFGTSVGNVGGGEDNLVTTPPLWANALKYDGQVVVFLMHGNFAANANNKTLRIYFGSVKILEIGPAAFSGGWSALVHCTRTNSTNQRVNATCWVASQTVFNGNVFNTSETITSDITVKATGESAAAASNDIVQSGFSYSINGAWSAQG